MIPYDPHAWFWIVGGDESRLWSSAARAYLPSSDQTYQAWLARGGVPTRIASEEELWDALRQQAPEALPDGVERPRDPFAEFDALKAVLIEKAVITEQEIEAEKDKSVR